MGRLNQHMTSQLAGSTLWSSVEPGYYWSGALLVRPTATVGEIVGVLGWNDSALWRGHYGSCLDGLTCFAEDVFGGQFVFGEGGFFFFDPETAELEKIAQDLESWIDEIVAAADFRTGEPMLVEWLRTGATLRRGMRLVPRTPFFLGGDYAVDNLIEREDVVAMRARAQLWNETKDLQDGQRIVIRQVP
jgi:hypothetical protein